MEDTVSRDYTVEEIQGAVAKIVRTSVRRQYGALGNRRTDITFSDVQDAAAGVFLLNPNAPYYVILLAVRRLLELLETCKETLADLNDTIVAMARVVEPVEVLSHLGNARSALTALSQASSARETPFDDIEDVPAYKRLDQATSRFLAQHGKNIKSGGSIVQTPAEARARLAALITTAKEQYEEVMRRAILVRDALEDYDSMDLPATLAEAVLENSRDVIGDAYDALAALSPDRRLEILRSVVLDVLAVRSTVRGLTSLGAAGTFLYFDGLGYPYADAQHPADAAYLESETYGPWAIVDDTTLDLTIDGGTSISVDLPESYVASIGGLVEEPYDIDAGVNDELTLQVTGFADLDITLTAGGTQTSEDVATDINGVLGTRPVVAEPYTPSVRFTGEVDFANPVGSAVEVSRVGGDWSYSPSQPAVGDWLYISGSGSGNDGWYQVTDVANLPTFFEATKATGSPATESGVLCELGTDKRAVRIRFKDADAVSSVQNGWSIGLKVDGDSVKQQTHITLGIPTDITVDSYPTTAESAAAFINLNPTIAPAGSAMIVAETVFSPTLYSGDARTEPTDALLLVAATLRTTCDVSSGGTSATFSGITGVTLADFIAPGDVVAFRETTSNSLTNYGIIDTVGTDSFVATMDSSAVVETDVVVEVGPDFSGNMLPLVLKVDNDPPDVNDGTYSAISLGGVDGTGPNFELTLDRALPLHADNGAVSRDMEIHVGQNKLKISSVNTLMSSGVVVETSSTAGSTLWSSLPQSAEANTVYFYLPEAPTAVEQLDSLEFKDTGAQTPSLTRSIAAVSTSPNLLELFLSLPASTSSYNMRQNAPAPSARVRRHKRDNYDSMRTALVLWLNSHLVDADTAFAGLRRLVNPIAANQNPTATAIGEASTYVAELYAYVDGVRSSTDEYNTDRVESVDTLLTTYQQHGADRAADVLLEARFSDFFGLDQDGVSYAGELQAAVQDVMRKDLPQSKMNRLPDGEIVEEYEEIDYEYDVRDTEGEEDVDPIDEAYEYGEGSAI